jgi:cell division transport system permease protein
MVNFNVALLPSETDATLDLFCQQMRHYDFVTGVAYQENVVDELREVFYKLSWFLIVFVALLLIITILLISSLIRIAIFSRRDTIATMRLVGAKASFIARPFRLRSIAYGAIGGLIADALTFFTVWAFSNEFALDIIGMEHLMWYGIIGGAIVLVGIAITYLSTALTVRLYISKN